VTILLALLRRYWLHIVVVAALSLLAWRAYDWAYDNGASQERGKWLAKENAALAVALSQLQNANVQRDKAQARADALGKHPPKVIERIHEYPSGCVRPAPVADAVRVQVDDTNRAIRDMR
jgi:hypothetical protein